MNPAFDPSKLSGNAQKIIAPEAPAGMRMAAASGKVPLGPLELVSVVAFLTEHSDAKVAETARNTLKNLPSPVMTGALAPTLAPGVIDTLARIITGRDDMLEKVVQLPQTSVDTLCYLAQTGSEALTEIVATNEARLLADPTIIEKLYFNKYTRMSTIDRLIDLASRNNVEVKGIPSFKELAEALQNELIPEPDGEPSPSDLLFQEVDEMAQELEREIIEDALPGEKVSVYDALEPAAEPEDPSISPTAAATVTRMLSASEKKKKPKDDRPLHARIATMSMSEKIRMATIGPGAARALFLKDTNKLVAEAAIRSPMVQEQDVARISKSRTVHEAVLRYISQKGDWIENHEIKYNLVSNPRCPVAQASKFIGHLRDDELKRLEKNRDVNAATRTLIKQQLQRKMKKQGAK